MNSQQVSQVMTFYRINFDFHDPYRLILDGNFIKILVEREIDFKRKLENAIPSGKFKFYVPSCLLRELELLGQQFKFVHQKAKEFKKLHCKHDFTVNVDQCMVENFIKDSNPEKYIVCTQDIELRRTLRRVINCPLMYFGPDQRIKFEDFNKKNAVIVEKMENEKLLPKANEMQGIKEYNQQQAERKKQQEKKKLLKIASEQGVKAKTKIAKGPNPLSVKKKKNKPNFTKNAMQTSKQSHNNAEPQIQIGPPVEKAKRIRKRNRNRKNKTNNTEAEQ